MGNSVHLWNAITQTLSLDPHVKKNDQRYAELATLAKENPVLLGTLSHNPERLDCVLNNMTQSEKVVVFQEINTLSAAQQGAEVFKDNAQATHPQLTIVLEKLDTSVQNHKD